MVETKEEMITTTQISHTFYCDKCNKLLGTSIEFDDGWYPSYGDYEQKIHIDGYGWFYYNRTLCEECQVKTDTELIKLLKDFGFKEDKP